MFCRVGQNALAMQTHQPQIVDNNGGSARLTALDPPLRIKNSQPFSNVRAVAGQSTK